MFLETIPNLSSKRQKKITKQQNHKITKFVFVFFTFSVLWDLRFHFWQTFSQNSKSVSSLRFICSEGKRNTFYTFSEFAVCDIDFWTFQLKNLWDPKMCKMIIFVVKIRTVRKSEHFEFEVSDSEIHPNSAFFEKMSFTKVRRPKHFEKRCALTKKWKLLSRCGRTQIVVFREEVPTKHSKSHFFIIFWFVWFVLFLNTAHHKTMALAKMQSKGKGLREKDRCGEYFHFILHLWNLFVMQKSLENDTWEKTSESPDQCNREPSLVFEKA